MSKLSVIFLTLSIFLASCASTTMIISDPPGAKVYLNGEPVGATPYEMKDTKIVGSCTSVVLKKNGYSDVYAEICRDEQIDAGAIVGGIFFTIPFLWLMKYKPYHRYELVPMDQDSGKL
jgi:hypothetical protein